MPASHCPDFYADGNTIMEIFKIGTDRIQIGLFVVPSLTIFNHRPLFLAFGDNFGKGSKFFNMLKNPRRCVRCWGFVLSSYHHPHHRNVTGNASLNIVLHSCFHRFHRAVLTLRCLHEWITKIPEGLTMATRLREDLVIPSCCHRIKVRRRQDGTTTAINPAKCKLIFALKYI